MKPWEERGIKLNIRTAIYNFMGGNAHNREGMIIAFNPPPIPGLGTTGGAEFYIQSKGEGNVQQLAQVTLDFIAKASQQYKVGDMLKVRITAAQGHDLIGEVL